MTARFEEAVYGLAPLVKHTIVASAATGKTTFNVLIAFQAGESLEWSEIRVCFDYSSTEEPYIRVSWDAPRAVVPKGDYVHPKICE